MLFRSFNGGPGSVNSSPIEGSNQSPNYNPYDTSTPADNQVPSTDTPTTQLSGDSNVSKVYNYWWEKLKAEGSASGDLKCIVSAIVGNCQIESGDGINAQAYNPADRGETSVGICQWRGGKYDRLNPMLSFCGVNGPVGKGNLPTLDRQLDFMWHEFHTSERKAYNHLLSASTIQDAVVGMIMYERDASYVRGQVDTTSPYYLKKLQKARTILSSMSYSGGNA